MKDEWKLIGIVGTIPGAGYHPSFQIGDIFEINNKKVIFHNLIFDTMKDFSTYLIMFDCKYIYLTAREKAILKNVINEKNEQIIIYASENIINEIERELEIKVREHGDKFIICFKIDQVVKEINKIIGEEVIKVKPRLGQGGVKLREST